MLPPHAPGNGHACVEADRTGPKAVGVEPTIDQNLPRSGGLGGLGMSRLSGGRHTKHRRKPPLPLWCVSTANSTSQETWVRSAARLTQTLVDSSRLTERCVG